jgi:aspartate aminotransferase
LVVAALNQVPGISCHKPEGAFYVYPSIAAFIGKTSSGGRLIASDADFATALLDEAFVAVVQGAAFSASPHVRISTATSDAVLAAACERIAAFCDGVK